MHKIPVAEASSDSAQVAGLRYVTDAKPGFSRRRAGRGFVFISLDAKPIREEDQLRRIKALAIPPAWTDVWICPSPNGHLQATGRDSKRRKQYRYHSRWHQVRDETKYDRLISFGDSLPAIRRRVRRDLAMTGLPRDRVLATVVQLLEKALIRVGNECYARDNGSFGLTTLRNRHVSIKGSKLRFEFKGKSGRKHIVDVSDLRLAKIVKSCQDLPGYELFQYEDENGEYHSVESADVNEYLREISGSDFSAKDFRTWAGTVIAAIALKEVGAANSDQEAKNNIATAVSRAAEQLGNTPAVCRKCYVHPEIIDAYLDGSLEALTASRASRKSRMLTSDEATVLTLLKRIGKAERKKAA
ncbi:MAG: DNA topoisomerase IB [Acidobacteriota bacterium]